MKLIFTFITAVTCIASLQGVGDNKPFTLIIDHKQGTLTFKSSPSFHNFSFERFYEESNKKYSYFITKSSDATMGGSSIKQKCLNYPGIERHLDSQVWDDDKTTKKYNKLRAIIAAINVNASVTEKEVLVHSLV